MKKFLIIMVFLYGAVATEAQNVAYSFTNKVTFTKSGNGNITRFVAMLPLPQTNPYQEIAKLTYEDGDVVTDKNYGNRVLMADNSSFPSGGKYTLSYNFDVRPIPVKVNVSSIDIKPYDPESEPCKRHLGDRGEYVVTSNPYITETGDKLWSQSENIIDYARRCYEFVAKNFRYISGSWRTLEQIHSEMKDTPQA